MSLILLPNPASPVVAMEAWIAVGTADERPEQAGLSHVMEHMIFKGTAKLGAGRIAQKVEELGGEINAWTSRDDTVFHLVVPSQYAAFGVEILADALSNPAFDKEELQLELEVIAEEIRQGKDQPMRAFSQSMFATTFEGHAYQNPILGQMQSVSGFRRSDLVGFHRRWYCGSNINLVVAGRFDERRIKKKIEKAFSTLPCGPSLRRRKRSIPVEGVVNAHLQTGDSVQAHLALTFRVPAMREQSCAPLDLLSVALGQGRFSLLQQELVQRQGLCHSTYAYLQALRDYTLVVIGLETTSEQLDRAALILGQLLGAQCREAMEEQRLNNACYTIEADAVYQQETSEGIARSAGSYAALGCGIGFEAEYLNEIRRCSSEDLRASAKQIFQAPGLHLTAMLPSSLSLASVRSQRNKAKHLRNIVQGGIEEGATSSCVFSPGKDMAKTKSIKPRKAKPKKAKSSPFSYHHLDCGAEVMLKQDLSVPMVSLRAVWQGGQSLESLSNSGISTLLAKLLVRGGRQRSAGECMAQVDAKAASLEGISGRNSFGLRSEWLSKDWPDGFSLLMDCLLEPRFEEESIVKVKDEMLRRIEGEQRSPSHQAFSLLHQTLYPRHSYGLNGMGTVQSLSAISGRELKAFYAKHYPLSSLRLAIVGDICPDEILTLLQTHFKSRKEERSAQEEMGKKESKIKGVCSSTFKHGSLGKGLVQQYMRMDTEQAHVVLGFPGLAFDDADRDALKVLSIILGGQGGRLPQALRERRALVYQIEAFSVEGIYPGYWALHFSCAPRKVEEALLLLKSEIDYFLKNNKMSSKELSRAKHYLIGAHQISLQRRASEAAAMAFYRAYGLAFDEYLDYDKHIEKVGKDDVVRVAQRIFKWEAAVVVTVGPHELALETQRRMTGTILQTKKSIKKTAPTNEEGQIE